MLTRRSLLKSSSARHPCHLLDLQEWRSLRRALTGNYEHAEDWGNLAPEFRYCGIGNEQSPINFDHPIPSALGDLAVEWPAAPLDILNNGHTIQANVGSEPRAYSVRSCFFGLRPNILIHVE
jgi:carbonic anhydrase